MNDIYTSLKEQMNDRGMTPQALAEISGVGRSTIYRILSKKRRNSPTVDSMQKLLSALGIELKLAPVAPGNPEDPARSASLKNKE